MGKIYADITGWGKYAPEKVLTNHDLEQMVDTTDEWIVKRTGIHQRHIVAPGEHTSHMATKASRKALAMAGIEPTDLDLIIVASSSPDYLMPPVSSLVQDQLGATDVGAFTMVVGCTGFVCALITAQNFIQSGAYRRILVVGVELISRWMDWEDRGTCVVFGDGGAAVIMETSTQPCGILGHVMGSDGSGGEHITVPAGGVAMPTTHESLDARLNYVKMNGREVFKFATRIMGKALNQSLDMAGLTMDDVDLLIPHQANQRIIDFAAKIAGLPPEKVFSNVARYGNTSAASIPIAFCEAFEEGRLHRGDTVAMVAFGSGLTWASAIVKLGEA